MKMNNKNGASRSGGDRKNSNKKLPPKPFVGGIFIWILFILGLILMLSQFGTAKTMEIPYSQFRSQVDSNNIANIVVIADREIQGEFKTPIKQNNIESRYFKTLMPFADETTISELIMQGVKVDARAFSNVFSRFGPTLFFLVILIVFWFFMFRNMGKVPKDAMSFGQSKARRVDNKGDKITFEDVAGVEEAKNELREIVEFLKFPKKFERLGAKIPKGALLLGAPGTGKTLLARATAGEAGVPFFSMSGSDFVELFVGIGASRVRDLFNKGKKSAPCIIFIDELDAVGRYRGAGIGGGHDEREQTLNALLVEMDGFEANKGIIVMAATNRPDILDPALLRPGRFDRQIVVDRPDILGREMIFKVHIKKIPMSEDVDLKVLARGTPGFSGADIANTVNESALLAAKKGKDKVEMEDFEEAKDKVLMGVERKSLVLSENERKNTAYHEAGHVIVAKFTPGADPIHKVTIIPRGMALGITQQLPVDERKNYSREYCFTQLAVLCGGRAAEVSAINTETTGARNDIEQATELAHKMVCRWGMSDVLGPIAFGKKNEEIFLGREISQHRDFSEETAKSIDKEISKFVRMGETKAKNIIKEHMKGLHSLAKKLLEREVLTGDEIDEILGLTQTSKPPKPVSKQISKITKKKSGKSG
ncbi:MAG: ATP-dependent zinc metalloprotease FtsH [bacterium]|nr:ATP-dependent zinc metalloprotease FtsH [bacterium]